ncbi:MAG: TlpA family protein disulfide reductase [Flavobacteriales bacterium]|nr:TlpA family protein disulfide reductase [Flavobacteriales bacterium]
MKKIASLFFALTLVGTSVFAGGDGDKPVKVEEVGIGLNIGDEAPNLEFKDPNGKMVSLKSLRGKIVLIDFWASWCRPCRMENPNVVSAYKKFNKAKFKSAKGFEVYGVSLDKSQDAWVNAIQTDELMWTNVSDLGGWNSDGAATYGVRSIPANFLIDENGIIIAKGLRGANLHAELQKLVAN